MGHCCDDSSAFRKPCFDDLQIDETYISPPLSCGQVISLKEDLCKAQEEEFQTEKQKQASLSTLFFIVNTGAGIKNCKLDADISIARGMEQVMLYWRSSRIENILQFLQL